jgi:hypothetical protein
MNINRNDLHKLQDAYRSVLTESQETGYNGGMNNITHSARHNTQATHDAFVNAYEALHPNDQSDLRGCAYQELKGGKTDASSIMSQLYKWFQEYGSLDQDVIDKLRHFYL